MNPRKQIGRDEGMESRDGEASLSLGGRLAGRGSPPTFPSAPRSSRFKQQAKLLPLTPPREAAGTCAGVTLPPRLTRSQEGVPQHQVWSPSAQGPVPGAGPWGFCKVRSRGSGPLGCDVGKSTAPLPQEARWTGLPRPHEAISAEVTDAEQSET